MSDLTCDVKMRRIEQMFAEWIEHHPQLRPYMSIRIQPRSGFLNVRGERERKKHHEQLMTRLSALLTRIEKKRTRLEEKLAEAGLWGVRKVESLIYDDPEKNMQKRKLVFISRRLQRARVELVSLDIRNAMQDADEVRQLIDKLQNFPKDRMMEIADGYFNYPRESEDRSRLKFQVKAMRCKLAHMNKEIEKYKLPPYYQSFADMMIHAIEAGKENNDKDISYSPPSDFELELSRYVWNYDTAIGAYIDEVLSVIDKIPPELLVQRIVEASCTLIPNIDSRTVDEQSIGLVILFRLIFDRMHETHYDLMFRKDIGANSDRLAKLSMAPVKCFSIPPQFKMEYESENQPIREVFRSDAGMFEAAQFLGMSIFATNPIDALWYVHACLISIHKAGIAKENAENADSDDSPRLLCFDDLFSLLVGVLMAADVGDFHQLADFLDRFAPKQCLSNSLEYAQAGISALLTHCQRIDIEELRK